MSLSLVLRSVIFLKYQEISLLWKSVIFFFVLQNEITQKDSSSVYKMQKKFMLYHITKSLGILKGHFKNTIMLVTF